MKDFGSAIFKLFGGLVFTGIKGSMLGSGGNRGNVDGDFALDFNGAYLFDGLGPTALEEFSGLTELIDFECLTDSDGFVFNPISGSGKSILETLGPAAYGPAAKNPEGALGFEAESVKGLMRRDGSMVG